MRANRTGRRRGRGRRGWEDARHGRASGHLLGFPLRADHRLQPGGPGGGPRRLVSGTGPVVTGGRALPKAPKRRRGGAFLEIIAAALAEAGASLDDVVRTRMYITSSAHGDAVGTVHGELLGHVRPAATMVVVAGLLDPAWKVEIEAEADLS